MKIDCAAFRIAEGAEVALAGRNTNVSPLYDSPKHYRKRIEQKIAELTAMQSLLYANNRHSLLLIFQAMDAAGKDSAIKHVMSGVNPQGCQVFSFRRPSNAELSHDFLWRTTQCLPERGHIGIFNRSYYEEVLIVRVKSEILLSEALPAKTTQASDFWQQRYRSIKEMEGHLHRNGTRIIKFFLHLSKDEQGSRLLQRIDDPEKSWKFTTEDMAQRESWKQYQKAYENCLNATSTDDAPWYAVPADDKRNAHLIISEVILDALKSLRMTYPKPDRTHKRELMAMRKQLTA